MIRKSEWAGARAGPPFDMPLTLRRGSLPEMLAGKRSALGKRIELRPSDLRMHAATEPAVGGGNDVLGTDCFGEADDPVRDEFRMFDEIGRVRDDAGENL